MKAALLIEGGFFGFWEGFSTPILSFHEIRRYLIVDLSGEYLWRRKIFPSTGLMRGCGKTLRCSDHVLYDLLTSADKKPKQTAISK